MDFQGEIDDGDGHSEGLVRGCTFGADVSYRLSTDGAVWTDPFVGARGWVADVA